MKNKYFKFFIFILLIFNIILIRYKYVNKPLLIDTDPIHSEKFESTHISYFLRNNEVLCSEVVIKSEVEDIISNRIDAYFELGKHKNIIRNDSILDIKINKYELKDDIIYIYMDKNEFSNPIYNNSNFMNYIMTFVTTLTQKNNDLSVSFVLGDRIENKFIHGVDMDKIFKSSDIDIKCNEFDIVGFIDSFFYYLYTNQYSTSYIKINPKIRKSVNLEEFRNLIDKYKNVNYAKMPSYYRVNKNNDGNYKVSVFYETINKKEENWKIIKIGNKYYFDYNKDFFE